MARLIDADALLEGLTLWYENIDTINSPTDVIVYNVLSSVMDDINDCETIDAEPVRHGKWIVQKVDDIRTKFYCSECERCVWCGNDYFMKPTKYVAHVYPYCHCGAKMDGDA